MPTEPEQKGPPAKGILEAQKSTMNIGPSAPDESETQPEGGPPSVSKSKSWMPNPKWYGTLFLLLFMAFHMLYFLLEIWKEGVLLPSPFFRVVEQPYSLAGNEILIGAVIASIMGGLGSIIFCFKSLFNGVQRENNKAVYLALLFRPIYGGLLALIFYFLVRGGLIAFSGGSMSIPKEYPELDLMRASTAGVSGLVGMFSEQAMTRLKEFFDSLFGVKTG